MAVERYLKERGTPAETKEIAEHVGATYQGVYLLLNRLESAGVVHSMRAASGPYRWSLVREPANV